MFKSERSAGTHGVSDYSHLSARMLDILHVAYTSADLSSAGCKVTQVLGSVFIGGTSHRGHREQEVEGIKVEVLLEMNVLIPTYLAVQHIPIKAPHRILLISI